jgi:hypothetical protein
MPERRFRVLAIASHPVQYSAPLFRLMAQHPQLDFHVAYCTLRGAEAGHDPEFGTSIKWDVPLLDGYLWTHVPNRGTGSESFFGLYNPGLWKFIREGRFDAVLCHTGYIRASFWISYFAAKLSRTAFLFGTDSTGLTSRDGQTWKRAFKRLAWPWLFRLAGQVIVPIIWHAGPNTLARHLFRPHHAYALRCRQRMVVQAIQHRGPCRRTRILGRYAGRSGRVVLRQVAAVEAAV